MINIENYMLKLIGLLKQHYGTRLCYVGLQGSYLRGEATDQSDIDVVVVIEGLGACDLDSYRSIIESLDHYDKACGFICGKEDLTHWNPLEIWNFVNSTKDYYGQLHALVPNYTQEDVCNFTKLSLCNLYHEICHSYIHADRDQTIAGLPGCYKGVFFILQGMYYLRNGKYVATKAELLPLLQGKDYAVLKRSTEMIGGAVFDFVESFELLFAWCRDAMSSLQ